MPVSSPTTWSRSQQELDLASEFFEDGQIPEHLGHMEPRIWSRPKRALTPATSLGYEVINFAKSVLGVLLFPWQQWLLIHALELNEDGTYRFKKLVILVGRQNGKTTLLTILSLWWLFVDSLRDTNRIPPSDFLILGTAQDLDTATEAWDRTLKYCDPDPENEAGIPDLMSRSLKPLRVNGGRSIRLKKGQKYKVKAATRKSGRGKSASRIIMDELREQQTFESWAAITKTMNAIWNAQLWTISNAGDAKSVVLAHVRNLGHAAVKAWAEQVETEQMDIAEWEREFDGTLGLFEWSALEDCEINDADQIARANPSLGYVVMWETIMSDMKTDPLFVFRTEVLCQWVTAAIETYITEEEWTAQIDVTSKIDKESPVYVSVHVSENRGMSYIAIAGFRKDGKKHVEIVAQRAGMLWVQGAIKKMNAKRPIAEVIIQAKGTPAMELIEPIQDLDIPVYTVGGSELGSSTGQFRDKVRDGTVWHLAQPILDLAISGGTTKRLGDMQFWDLAGSPIDIAPLVAATYAVFGLDRRHEPERKSAYDDDSEDDGQQENADWWN